MATLPEQKPSAPKAGPFRRWLPGSLLALLLLLLTALLLAAHVVSSPTLRKKIRQTVAERTGAEIDWQAIGLSYFPTPAITLQQVVLAVPDRLQGRVAELRLAPEILPLLTGKLRLARLRLERPEISLELPAPEPAAPPAPAKTVAERQEGLERLLSTLSASAPDLDLVISDGRLSVAAGRQPLLAAESLDLQLALSAKDPRSAQATLRGEVAGVTIRRNDRREAIKGLELDGSLRSSGGALSVLLERLAFTEPGLALSGRLALAPGAPAITLSLAGEQIDVDATRRVALALAGDLPPVRATFDYLRGGRVPQITLESRGATASELGDWKNLRIEGKLQQGAVAIPAIKLDLTEVIADVLLADGVLEGRGMSTRLEGSSGHDGTLKVSLAEGNDLFQLELMLNADLAQAKRILERIVKNPDFNEELDRITRLQGTGSGRLKLGDTLSKLDARVDIHELNFTADYQRLPFPLEVSSGQVAFSEKRIDLTGWNGSVGHSSFTGLACQADLEGGLTLDARSGPATLSLDELYPWLASFDDAPRQLKDFTQIGGRLKLAGLSFRGAVDKPERWQFAASGTVENLKLKESRLPAEIRLVSGAFTLDSEQLSVDGLAAESLDAALTATGTAKGLPRGLDQIDVTFDGTLGEEAAAWLGETFEVPAAYTLRAPLSLAALKLSWQPEGETRCQGGVAVAKGPKLSLDVSYRPERLMVRDLTVKDRHSDAVISLASAANELSLDFAGTLQHETLEALFLDQSFGQGRLEGDFSVQASGANMAGAVARGQLKGSDLLLPLPSGDKLGIEQIVLAAAGAAVGAELTALSWKGRTWDPVRATIDFTPGKTHVRVAEAKLCGIDSPGVLTIAGKELALDFIPDGKKLDLSTSYSCLTQGKVRMTGTMDFSSHITARGQADELLRTMEGPLEMTFAKGVVKQGKLLARILEVLNVTEIVKGKLPDLGSGGFAYSTITLQGEFRSGKLRIEKLAMDGETLDMLGQGEIDMVRRTVNVELLAAPFKTVDTVVRNIPGVNYLLSGSLVAIPVSVKGPLDDPKVRVMSASAVGTGLLNLGGRVLKSPLKLIETVVPGREGQKSK